mgnify:CR=1 FL=1
MIAMKKNMVTKVNRLFLNLSIIWTGLFAAMSFYWAMGGSFGIKSLGGSIYEQSLNPEPSFIIIVWITGFVKLLGVVLLCMLLVSWQSNWIKKSLYFTTKIVSIFLFLYGLLNFITITLSALDILDFDLDSNATFWRLVFWEPFWMLGGIFYFFSIKKVETS